MQTVSAAHPVDGVLLLDKPVGITSNAAIQRVKRLFHAAKAGHVGTLDPLASGLLPVCLGEATKFSASAFNSDKHYDADILLGVTTDTGDIEGAEIARRIPQVDHGKIVAALRNFAGEIEQSPPMYSALKRNGRPLYSYARAGETVAREPRRIVIHEIVLRGDSADRVQISVHCSKGTYIRVLAEDIGRALGCGATLAGLRRTAVGAFDLTSSVTLDDLMAMPESQRFGALRPVDCLVGSLPELRLDAECCRRIKMGQMGSADPAQTLPGWVRMYDTERRFLGLGEVLAGGQLAPRRLIATAAGNGAASPRQ
jgi:tRNA pseudouridine55 synthase